MQGEEKDTPHHEMDHGPIMMELSAIFELFKEAQIHKDRVASDQLLSKIEVLLSRFKSLPPLPEQRPHAAQELSVARCSHCASLTGVMDNAYCSSSCNGMSDGEEACVEDNKDEEQVYATGSVTKLQPRKVKCRACWNDAMGMAEVIEQKGKMHVTMGIVRGGKLYCSIEETLFLAELGALVLLDNDDAPLPLRFMYEKVADGKVGCNWEMFEVYRHLKGLGFIIRRHGVPWSLKVMKDDSFTADSTEENGKGGRDAFKEEKSMIKQIQILQIDDLRPVFDVYLPNGKFRKSFPGDPVSHIYLPGSDPPSMTAVKDIVRRRSGVSLRFGHVDHGRVSFFTFEKVEVPVLP